MRVERDEDGENNLGTYKKKKNCGRTPKEKKVTIVPVQCVVKERENWAIRGLQSHNYIYSKSN